MLLCTDAAADGLNFQFCGAVVNYDMPWNPMRVEQRIGRIDRLGQEHQRVHIVNLHYEGTVETDVYRALRGRIRLFESVVGPLQPILSSLSRTIGEAVLRGDRERLGDAVAAKVDEEAVAFNIDAGLDEDIGMPNRPASPLTLEYLNQVLTTPALMTPGVNVRRLGKHDDAVRAPGMDSRSQAGSSTLASSPLPTFTPIPITAVQIEPPATPSTRMPASLRSRHTTSFGHLSPTAPAPDARSARTAATPIARLSP